MRDLDEDAAAVAELGIGADGAAMVEIVQDLQALLDDGVGLAVLHVGDEADAAGILLHRRVVEPLCVGMAGSRTAGKRSQPVAPLDLLVPLIVKPRLPDARQLRAGRQAFTSTPFFAAPAPPSSHRHRRSGADAGRPLSFQRLACAVYRRARVLRRRLGSSPGRACLTPPFYGRRAYGRLWRFRPCPSSCSAPLRWSDRQPPTASGQRGEKWDSNTVLSRRICQNSNARHKRRFRAAAKFYCNIADRPDISGMKAGLGQHGSCFPALRRLPGARGQRRLQRPPSVPGAWQQGRLPAIAAAMNFISDNTAGASAPVMAAIAAANDGSASAYGTDSLDARRRAALRRALRA